jgi:hypothetical protein
VFTSSAIRSSNGTDLFDDVLATRIPPAKNIFIRDWEKPIKIRAGTGAIVKMYINATDINVKEKETFSDTNSSDGVNISFSPNPVIVPLTGINYTNMLIKVDKKAYNGIPTKTNQLINISRVTDDNLNYSDSPEILEIEILPPLSQLESVGETLRNSSITYIIPLGVTLILILWIAKKIDKNRNYDSIRVKDLLTVDASVIAGVLIFLTVGSAELFSGLIQRAGVLTASIVFPFAIATIRTLIKGEVEAYAVKFTVAGFIYLMTSVIIIAFLNS